MIPQELIEKAKKFAYIQTEKYKAPSLFQVEFTNEKGRWLAEEFGADKDIVLLGTLLMDCMIGVAIQEGRREKHVEMSEDKTRELLSEFSDLDKEVRENIIWCIKQHHGADKFYSLESEICCNADCYRFVSVKGVLGGIKFYREAPLKDIVNLYLEKADGKWQALTLDICKKELEPQYRAVKFFLGSYRE